MKVLYDAALLPLRAAAVAYQIWPRATAGGALERDQRMGRRLPSLPPGTIWIHGASLGEARIAAALGRELKRRAPHTPVALSAMTPTGRATLPGPPDADAAFFLPLDFRDVQRRAFDTLAPGALVLVETELWPNLLAEAAARGVPACLVNARLAPERLARYRRFRGMYRPALESFAAIGAASASEADRLTALGAHPARITVTGNVKFDLPAPRTSAESLRARFGLPPGRPVLVAGSTAAGEDSIVLDAFRTARRDLPDLALVLAPRHPDRFAAAAAAAAAQGLRVHRLASGTDAPAEGADVLVVDTVGELATLYALGTASFVGGSLVPVGGHNVLEPLAARSPVLFGPHVAHVADIAGAVLEAEAGEQVHDAAALGRAVVRLARDPDERSRRVARGTALLESHRGALARTAELVAAIRPAGPR